MFDTVLVANRGEIAVRIIRTLRRLGIRSVAVYSDADTRALHVQQADEALRLGPAPALESYLSIERVIDAAKRSGAQAIHPGYGFLSENADFVRACAEAGIVFIGPPAEAMDAMGDKIRAKATVATAGVPVVPGSDGRGLDDDQLFAAVEQVGYPILLKPSAGGGGKGMHQVYDADHLADAVRSARREARSSFGDDTLLVERLISNPRHIEVQVLADTFGSVVHLGERECSLQRRHQKIIEEAPSPLLDDTTRAALGASAVGVASACGYVGVGTVEFIVSADSPTDFFFIEMNTRLQVEHPVTELITGLDLVEAQVRVAAGEPLGIDQEHVTFTGHAVEARVYAEDPRRGFVPTGGRVLQLVEPTGDGIRVDSGLAKDVEVGSSYDPMLAKVIAWGPDRTTALKRLDDALGRTTVLGVITNTSFLRRLLAVPEVRQGDIDTNLVERIIDSLTTHSVPDEVFVAAAAASRLSETNDRLSGWRGTGPAWSTWRLRAPGEEPKVVRLRRHGRTSELEADVDGREFGAFSLQSNENRLTMVLADRRIAYALATDADTIWLGREGTGWALTELETYPRGAVGAVTKVGGSVSSPMPGTVIDVRVEPGQRVVARQPLVVVEAMKMEHVVLAPIDGIIATLDVVVGQQVDMDQRLASVVAEGDQ
jgi:acetyl-CoA/propionyl-CoA carboxylase biotin carboxyl carrier protein